jgi:6-phosphogluconolactonase (cycloisomerase 2 family)
MSLSRLRLSALVGTIAFASSAPAAHAVALTPVTNCGANCTGLSSPQAVATSADGKHVYVVNPSGGSQGNGSLKVYSRNASSGALTLEQTFSSSGNPCQSGVRPFKGATGVAVAPDGNHVYVSVSFSSSLLILSRNSTTGQVSCAGRVVDSTNLRKATSVSVSPDNLTVYATATTAGQDRVTTYSRNTTTGALTFVQSVRDGTAAGGNSLSSPTATITSPDGAFVYATAAGDNAVTRFTRDTVITYGRLLSPAALVDNGGSIDGLRGVAWAAMSPDGKHLYTAAPTDNAIGVFARNSGTGALTYVEKQQNGVGAVVGLAGARGVAVTPDGSYVLSAASTSNAVALFGRDPSTGKLSFIEQQTSNLGGARSIAVRPAPTPGDKVCAYVAASSAGRIEGFCLGATDFGDAPNNGTSLRYPTTLAQAGARHVVGDGGNGGTLSLGGTVDSENNGVSSLDADGDDLAGSDDEDGVLYGAFAENTAGDFTLSKSGTGANGTDPDLDVWVDFNGDGDFDDSGERVYSGTYAALPSLDTVTITPPLGTSVNGDTYARFRIQATGSVHPAPGGGGGVGEVEDYKINITSDTNPVTVTKVGNGSGTVASLAPYANTIDCGTTCTASFPDTATAVLHASPGTGSNFTGWDTVTANDCSSFGTSDCSLGMSAPRTAIAVFDLQQVLLTVNSTNGTVTSQAPHAGDINCGLTCTHTYDYGTQVELLATPDANYTFNGWTGGDCESAGTGPCLVTITAATNVTATFVLNARSLHVDLAGSGGGTVSSTPSGITCGTISGVDCDEAYTINTVVDLGQLPDGGSVFTSWTGCDSIQPGNVCRVTMSANKTVTATFDVGADLAVNVVTTSVPADDGGTATVEIRVTNPGPIDITGATLTSVLPVANIQSLSWSCVASGTGAGTTTLCDTGGATSPANLNETVDVAVGGQLTYTVTVIAPTPAIGGFSTSATVTVNGLGELDPANNSDTEFTGYKKIFADGFENGLLVPAWSGKTP